MKQRLLRIIIAAVLFVVALIIPSDYIVAKAIGFFASYIIVGYDVVLRALKSIVRGNAFNENLLMSIATIGAFIIGEYPEAVAVMLFYQVGELFQSYAVDKSRKSITALMEIRPDYANLKTGNTDKRVDAESVKVDDIIVVKPGERIPLDGMIIQGTTALDTSALTGESLPRNASVGDEVLSGCINMTGLLEVRVTSEFEESTISKILEMVEEAADNKAKTESFITRFARYYTPAVVIIALILGLVPPLLIADATFSDWIYRALAFLVVSCPCALVISVPLSFFGGIGGASKAGILVKGGNYIEALAKAKVVVFDKTGTLTKGTFAVADINSQKLSDNDLLELVALTESSSSHPISQSILTAYGKPIDKGRVSEIQEIAGHGIQATIDGSKTVLAGNHKLMELHDIDYEQIAKGGTVIYVASNDEYLGYILVGDEIKEGSHEALESLRKSGVEKTIMLSGDNSLVANTVGESLGIDEVYSELLPGDKLEILENVHGQLEKGQTLIFVGDGINDAPSLARADVGVAMGGLGTDAAIEAADVVIMNDDLRKLPVALRISNKTLAIARENIVLALGIKAIVLVLAAMGIATMWEAVFADVGVTVLAVLNSFRAMRNKA